MIHGWGGNRKSFKSILPLLKIPSCAWYFPEGPYILENNDLKRSWAFKNNDGEFEVKEDATKAEIKRAFTKSLKGKKMNKKILSEFIELVA